MFYFVLVAQSNLKTLVNTLINDLSLLYNIGRHCSAVDVFKSLNHCGIQSSGIIFERLAHGKNARGNRSFAKLSKVRTAIGKKSFARQGALMFNDLKKSLRDERSLLKFKEKLNSVY